MVLIIETFTKGRLKIYNHSNAKRWDLYVVYNTILSLKITAALELKGISKREKDVEANALLLKSHPSISR